MTSPRIGTTTAPSLHLLSERELVSTVLADDYEILEELGRGGMAIVYRAREKTLDREVAIKVLPTRLAIDQGFVERFEHEARTAAKLEHPNIVPIYRVGRAGPNGEVSYFVMKLLRGQSLSAVLQERGKLGASDVRRILMETASALGYAAKRGVVHRDIKPDNIMLDSEGRCVITDFGIAKAPGGQQTTAGTSLGTPRYMSPEHAMGLPLDGRSDMYSLGIVAYIALTGIPPFVADEPFAVLYKHIHEPLPEPTLTTDDERQLYAIIARMLAKKPDDRYQNGNELIAALGGNVSDPSLIASMISNDGLMAPTEVMPTPRPWTIDRWRRMTRGEKRLTVLLAATAALAIYSFTADRAPTGAPVSSSISGPVAPSSAALVGAGSSPASGIRADSAPRPAAPAGPSERAAAILAYNKFRSNCPRRDTLVSAKPIAFAVLVDSIHDRTRGKTMDVSYDICGAPDIPFTTTFTLTKLNQRRLSVGKQQPHVESIPENASSPRSRKKHQLDIHEMSNGNYRLDVNVKLRDNRELTSSRNFRISDK
jgi:tRNA A-37 threonylcarbamoyl transferase component Bud32